MLRRGKKYRIYRRRPHLLVRGEKNRLLLIDTGFNGSFEEISDSSVFSEKATWVGSKYLTTIGSCLVIDFSNKVFSVEEKCPKGNFTRIPFNKSSSCTGVQALNCPLGPIVTVPVKIKHNGENFKANAFVDTGSGYSVVIRSLLTKNQFKKMKIDECTSNLDTEDVTIDGQNIKFKPRNLSLSFMTNNGGIVSSGLNKMMIACGKTDKVSSSDYNDKLGKLDLNPMVQVTVGNDALKNFKKIVIDYAGKNMYVDSGVSNLFVRQKVEKNDWRPLIFVAILLFVILLSKRSNRAKNVLIFILFVCAL